MKKENSTNGNPIALLPIGVFLVLYLGLGIIFEYVLKIEIPDLSEEEYLYGIRALQIAGGNGYAKLFAFDKEKRACLIEKLGEPLHL